MNAKSPSTVRLTGTGMLARNTIWNLIGQGVPMVVAVFTIPLLVKGLGTDRFGILTLAWIVIGYFSLFDLGMGRALTKQVAEKLGAGQAQEIPAVTWTALALMLFLGLVGMGVQVALSPWLVHDALKIPPALQRGVLHAFYLLALSIPIVISGAGLRGVLEAHQRFGLVNTVRLSMGVFTFLGPLMVLPFSRDLTHIVVVLVAGQALAWLAYLLLCVRVVPHLLHRVEIHKTMISPLLRFGGWLTVTNIVGPLMVYLDRFLIGALISVSAVTYYSTPYEVVTRLGFIPAALSGVLFPAFAASFMQDRDHAARLFRRGVKYIFMVFFPLALLVVTLAHEGLALWLGETFAHASTGVLQWLAAGVFINGLAQIPYALVQGSGRPDITAKLHLIELPLYLATVWWLISIHGIVGAAIAWTARVAVDALLLFVVVRRMLPDSGVAMQRLGAALLAALAVLALGAWMPGAALRLSYSIVSTSVFAVIAWIFILLPEERGYIKSVLRQRGARFSRP